MLYRPFKSGAHSRVRPDSNRSRIGIESELDRNRIGAGSDMARILSFEEREWGGTTAYYVTMSEYSLFQQGCTTDHVSVSMGRYYTLSSSPGIISSEERKRGGTP